MSAHDSVALLLKTLDRPVAPRPEFADALRQRLLAELPETNGHRAWRPRFTLPPRPRRRRRVLAAALAIALITSALAAVLLSRPAPASALEVVQRARQQFLRLPPFEATIVEKGPGVPGRIVYRRFYRGPNAWRSEYASVVPQGDGAHTGDYYVWNGRFEGQYQANTNRFYFYPGAMVRKEHREYMATDDLDPHFYFWPGAAVNKRLPADQYFKRRCKVLPNQVVAGREARHLACQYGPYGRLDALKTSTISIWLDAQYGFILKIAWPTHGSLFEVRKITLNPAFPPGVFQVQAPPGSKPVWGGSGVPPPALREKLTSRVAATIPVGSHPGSLAAGAGSLWVVNIGAHIADGSLSRIDPRSNRVISTIKGLKGWALTYAAGSIWVVTNGGRLERIDPASNRQGGPAIAVGGGTTPSRDIAYGAGTLWTVGGKVRTAHFPNGMSDSSYASLVRINPANGRVILDIPIQGDLAYSAAIAVGEGSTWVATYRPTPSGKSDSTVLVRVDPEHNRVVSTLTLGSYSLGRIVTALGSIWLTVGNYDHHGYLIRIDPRSNRIIAKIRVGKSPDGIAVSPGAIWVANSEDGTLSKIDPATNRVVGTPLPVGDYPGGALYAYGALWVADNQDNTLVRINRPDLPYRSQQSRPR
jgi:DNA-binding beta-propeller fold protein YncE/outer membrane lipoprotein-sorting protein